MSAAYKVENMKYELVAPDGGWGYMIFISFIVNMSIGTGFFTSFGMLFNDFIIEIEMSSMAVTFFSGIYGMSYAISGFFTSSMLKLVGRRKLAILASLLLDVGLIGMVFANSVTTFCICQGILPGVSIGITYNLINSSLNDYFVKKRMFIFSFGQLIISLISMVVPMFLKWSLNEYGFRGTLILIAGISLNNIFASLLMQPVEWHMKRVEVVAPQEVQPLVGLDEKTNAVVIKLSDKNVVLVEENNDIVLKNEKPTKLRKFAEAFIDVDFLLKFVKSCVCIGISLCTFAEATFSLILPQALYSFGWNQDMVAMALSLYSFGDLAMRVLLVCTSKWFLKIGIQEVYIFGLLLATGSILGLIWSERVILVYMYIVLMGLSRCFVMVLLTVVVADAVPPENFSLAIGTIMLFCGIISTTFGPAIGAIRDLTHSYSTAFYLLTSCFVIIIIFWSIELLYKKNKSKRNAKKAVLAK